jgi:hypothetical protein
VQMLLPPSELQLTAARLQSEVTELAASAAGLTAFAAASKAELDEAGALAHAAAVTVQNAEASAARLAERRRGKRALGDGFEALAAEEQDLGAANNAALRVAQQYAHSTAEAEKSAKTVSDCAAAKLEAVKSSTGGSEGGWPGKDSS